MVTDPVAVPRSDLCGRYYRGPGPRNFTDPETPKPIARVITDTLPTPSTAKAKSGRRIFASGYG